MIQDGLLQRWIADNAYETSRDLASGARPRVGANIYVEEDSGESEELFQTDPLSADRQRQVLADHLLSRDETRVGDSLRAIAAALATDENVMPSVLEAARAGATVGEISDAFRRVFGEYVERVPW